MNRLLIDTNSYSRLYKGDKIIEERLSKAKEVLISVVSLGELYLGFREGTRRRENLIYLRKFLNKSSIRIVNVDQKTSDFYSQVKYELRRKGKPIPENDIWIAAQVIETRSTLVTYDRHFLAISGLKVWKGLKKSQDNSHHK